MNSKEVLVNCVVVFHESVFSFMSQTPFGENESLYKIFENLLPMPTTDEKGKEMSPNFLDNPSCSNDSSSSLVIASISDTNIPSTLTNRRSDVLFDEEDQSIEPPRRSTMIKSRKNFVAIPVFCYICCSGP